MMIRKPNFLECMLFGLEKELTHLESLAKTMHDAEERTLLHSSIKRMQELIPLLLESLAKCEEAGLPQSQREAQLAKFARDISLVNQHMYLEIG